MGKKFKAAAALVDPKKTYSTAEAMELAKQTSTTKFDGTVEVHIRLGIDPKKSDQQVRGTVSLPNGSGKTKKIIAFVSADKEKEAKDAGADAIGTEETIAEIAKTGKFEWDLAVATPDMMPKMAKVAKVLGPKGLMPNPKSETVSTNVTKMVSEPKKGKVAFKSDDYGIVHTVIGKVSFDAKALAENYEALLEAIRKIKPSSSKGVYLKTATVATTMGPAIRTI
ncbi:MAG: 50S ribosomal protein L1 [Patescibacteria group bacterium]|nr:MAG: 50S ribosomal protein L1 [Patescibacteria group bacterium]